MITGALYLTGANIRTVRAIEWLKAFPDVWLFTAASVSHPEIRAIVSGASIDNVSYSARIARDTVDEVFFTKPEVLRHGIEQLILIAEPGHLDRAWRIMSIAYKGTDVEISVYATHSSGYRSSWWRTTVDIVRAYWRRYILQQ